MMHFLTTFTLLDPLFRLPLITGILASISLPILGVLLQARREWLAALGLSHVSAATQLVGLGLQWGITLTTGIAALLALGVQACIGKKGNASYALMILLGWSTVYLYAANHNMGEQMAHAMSDGQLLLVSQNQLYTMLVIVLMFMISFPILLKQIIQQAFFPLHAALNAINQKPILAWFYIITALLLTTSTGSLGLMATFALLFVTPLISFKLTKSLKQSVWLSSLFGFIIYIIAMSISLQFDQPFGGVMVMMLLLVLIVVTLSTDILKQFTRSVR